jgi:hypothetical protein
MYVCTACAGMCVLVYMCVCMCTDICSCWHMFVPLLFAHACTLGAYVCNAMCMHVYVPVCVHPKYFTLCILFTYNDRIFESSHGLGMKRFRESGTKFKMLNVFLTILE